MGQGICAANETSMASSGISRPVTFDDWRVVNGQFKIVRGFDKDVCEHENNGRRGNNLVPSEWSQRILPRNACIRYESSCTLRRVLGSSITLGEPSAPNMKYSAMHSTGVSCWVFHAGWDENPRSFETSINRFCFLRCMLFLFIHLQEVTMITKQQILKITDLHIYIICTHMYVSKYIYIYITLYTYIISIYPSMAKPCQNHLP